VKPSTEELCKPPIPNMDITYNIFGPSNEEWYELSSLYVTLLSYISGILIAYLCVHL
jgi:hypothetical protein